MLWQELSWPAIQAMDKNMPVVIPLGSCEQHGHHLPLYVDTMQVQAIVDRVEKTLSDQILLVPTLWLGCSHHHKDFPGTISVLPSVYAQMIQEMARSILRAGFTRLFFINGHGGNRVPAAHALTELIAQDDLADSAYIALASWWEVASESITPGKLGMSQPGVAHACEYETSLMLAIRPDMVAMDRIQTQDHPVLANDWYHSEQDASKRVAIFPRTHRLSAPGPLGEPGKGTCEKGQSLLQAVVDDTAVFLKDFATWPPLKVLGPK